MTQQETFTPRPSTTSPEIINYYSKPFAYIFWEMVDNIVSALNNTPLVSVPINIFVMLCIKRVAQSLPLGLGTHGLNLVVSLLWSSYNSFFSQYQISFQYFSTIFLLTYANFNGATFLFQKVIAPEHITQLMSISNIRYLGWFPSNNLPMVLGGLSSLFIASEINKPLAILYRATNLSISRPLQFFYFLKEELTTTLISVVSSTLVYSGIWDVLKRPQAIIPPRGRTSLGHFIPTQTMYAHQVAVSAATTAWAGVQVAFAEAMTTTIIENVIHMITYSGKSSATEKPALLIADTLQYLIAQTIANFATSNKILKVMEIIGLKMMFELILYYGIDLQPNLLVAKNSIYNNQ